ncbi:MAG: DUF1385 domain-containing protein [Oscillospiraceae bacterium]|nr:DUF1385 domain-containing protein [Oscillospiraceae bacterium]
MEPLSAEAEQSAAKAEYAHKSKIGGQALIEGVMMKGAFRGAMACRLPNGEIDLETWELPASFETDPKTGKQRVVRKWYQKVPLVRGCVNFVLSMADGYRCMMKSAEKQFDEEVDDFCAWKKHEKIEKLPEEAQFSRFGEWLTAEREKIDKEKAKEDKDYQPLGIPDAETIRKRWDYLQKAAEHYDYEEPGKIEQWLDDKLGDKIFSIIMTIALILGMLLAIGLFMYLPKLVVSWIKPLTESRIIKSCAEGLVKIVLFVLYMWLTGLGKSIRRTYEYHGAEHKTIACFEAALPLTVENVKKQCRFHPRCGTSFIFLVLLIGIFFGCFNPYTVVWQRVLFGFALLPLIMGVSYELIRIAGRYDNIFTRILSAPGLWMQRITTREPDASQIECAIAAMEPCIPENMEDDIW